MPLSECLSSCVLPMCSLFFKQPRQPTDADFRSVSPGYGRLNTTATRREILFSATNSLCGDTSPCSWPYWRQRVQHGCCSAQWAGKAQPRRMKMASPVSSGPLPPRFLSTRLHYAGACRPAQSETRLSAVALRLLCIPTFASAFCRSSRSPPSTYSPSLALRESPLSAPQIPHAFLLSRSSLG